MPLKTGKEYLESLRQLKPRVFALGEQIASVADHPWFQPRVHAALRSKQSLEGSK